MKNLTLAVLGVIGVGTLIGYSHLLLKTREAVENEKNGLFKDICKKRDPEKEAIFDHYDTVVDKIETLKEKEASEVYKKVDEYKKTSGIMDKMNDIRMEGRDKLVRFKEDIDYDALYDKYMKEPEKKIAEYKASVNYDETMDNYEASISEIKRNYEKQKLFLDLGKDDEQTKAVKEAAKDAKKKGIKKIEEKINTMKEGLSSVEKEANEEKTRKITALKKNFETGKKMIFKETEEKLSAFDKDVEAHRIKFREEVLANRTEAELALFEDEKALAKEVDKIHLEESEKFEKLVKNIDENKALGKWLKVNGYSRVGVAFVGVTPLVILWIIVATSCMKVCTFTRNYMDDLIDILHGMSEQVA